MTDRAQRRRCIFRLSFFENCRTGLLGWKFGGPRLRGRGGFWNLRGLSSHSSHASCVLWRCSTKARVGTKRGFLLKPAKPGWLASPGNNCTKKHLVRLKPFFIFPCLFTVQNLRESSLKCVNFLQQVSYRLEGKKMPSTPPTKPFIPYLRHLEEVFRNVREKYTSSQNYAAAPFSVHQYELTFSIHFSLSWDQFV